MIKLPVEVLNLIFEKLFQRDQLECMTVCRQWYDIISQHSFFSVIYIHSPQKLNKLIERVKRNPALGSKVKQLTLNLNVGRKFDEMIFLKFFPNLAKFTLIKYQHSDHNEASVNQLKYHPWCETIEEIMEIRSGANTVSVLNSGLCKNLSRLTLTGHVTLGNFEPIHNLVRVLANAPSLKSLHLRSYLVSLSDLESVHRSLSSLNTLILQNIKFDCSSFPLTIVPATSVRSFQSLFNSTGDYNTYYRYISQKYTDIEELALEMGTLTPYIRQLIQGSLDYRTTIKSYLKTLGHRLVKLSIPYDLLAHDTTSIFDLSILNECYCHIKQLKLLSDSSYPLIEFMPNTIQVHYLQSLEISLFGCAEKVDVSLEWLRQFIMLKRLIMTFSSNYLPEKRYTLTLPYFLELLGETKVEDLTLGHCELNNDSSKTTSVYTLLKSLSLSRVVFKENIDAALSQAFPNMSRLKLTHCSLSGSDLLLPNSYLSYLEISSIYSSKDAFVLVNTIDNNQQRLYTDSGRQCPVFQMNFPGEKEKLSNFISNRSKRYDKETDIPTLTITCKLLWSFVMEHNSH